MTIQKAVASELGPQGREVNSHCNTKRPPTLHQALDKRNKPKVSKKILTSIKTERSSEARRAGRPALRKTKPRREEVID